MYMIILNDIIWITKFCFYFLIIIIKGFYPQIRQCWPRLWKRYVDDTCSIAKRNTVEGLLNHLNSIRPSIQFTFELKKDGSLPFLNTLLRRRKDGTLNITVYRKTTHTDLYLNFKSHHPIHVRKGLVQCLYDRARKVTTTPADLRKEEEHLENVLKLNGYPT